MAKEDTCKPSEAYPMNGGDGRYSYTKNSYYQKGIVVSAKELINEAITEKLDIKNLSSLNTFKIADLGCSVGPNTFFAVQNILEAVELKYQIHGVLNSQIPEFHVFFNDHASNDFNTLFTSLPPDRQYYAAAVPGSFYNRLFPDSSLHIVHSSYSIQWLSQVPKEVVDKSCKAWNKERIHYSSAPDEVVKAYSAQYAKDMDSFLHARAQEVVGGGLMALLVPGRPNGTPHSQSILNMLFDALGSCIMDMAKKGLVDGEKVDLFNIPVYTMSPEELAEVAERNGCFSIEGMEELPHPTGNGTLSKAQVSYLHIRATMEVLVKKHFGHEILDELFALYAKKLEESSFIFESGKAINLFALLKRKVTHL